MFAGRARDAMKILAVDTALGACSVAVLDGERVAAHRWLTMSRGHAEALAPMVRDVLAESNFQFADLDRLGVTTGPGTFTGQRVGLAFMRGLRVALHIPLVGVTTLEAMAAAAATETGSTEIAVLHEAKRGEVYAALYSQGVELLPVQVAEFGAMMAKIEERAGDGLALAGTGAEAAVAWFLSRGVRTHLSTIRQPDALWVARLAGCSVEPIGTARPLYLRAPDAKLARASVRLRPAEKGDGERLAALHGATMPRPWEPDFFEQTLVSPGGFAVIAEAHGAAMGFVLARAVAGEAEILSIGVSAAFRRNGLAHLLVAEAGRSAQARGAASMFLEVDENNLAARGLYAAHGFREAGRRKGYYLSEGGGDALLLRADLPLESPRLGNDPKVA